MRISGDAFVQGMDSMRKDPQTRTRVKALIAFAQSSPGATIRIEGHTDNQGNAQTNLSLSQQRADAVKNILRAAGIPANRIQSVGLGGEQPLAPNSTAQGRERNRRVEVILLQAKN
jgi:OOP family OmpA-OmpF porin